MPARMIIPPKAVARAVRFIVVSSHSHGLLDLSFSRDLLSGPDEVHIPRPAADVRTMCVTHFGAITETITVLVSSSRFLVVEIDRVDS